MGQLLDSYWLPMYAHLRYKQLSAEQAEDLIQDFMVAILDKRLLSIADPKRGKLRTLLLTALDRFVITQHRHETAAKRSPGRITSLDELQRDEIAVSAKSPAEAFDRAWCLDVLAQTLARMQRECEAGEQMLRWQVFERRVLGPLLDDALQPSYRELAQQLDLPDEKAAMNQLVSAKRQFARHMRNVIREYITRSGSAAAGQAGGAVDDQPEHSGSNEAAGEKADHQLAELAVRRDIEREIDELRSILARANSTTALIREIPRGNEQADPLKSAFWMRLTQRHAQQPTTLANMFQLGADATDDTQLDACFADVLNSRLRDLPGLEYEGPGTLRELVEDPAAPIELLRRVKDWANVCRWGQDALFPAPLANGIFFLVLALAAVHSGTRMTGMRDGELKAGYQWLLEQPWFESEYRGLLQRAIDGMEV
jgi:RNA polymerase sigma-70 factor (ECF subfamily)